MTTNSKKLMFLTAGALLASSPAIAQEATLESVQGETAFIFNTVHLSPIYSYNRGFESCFEK